MKLQIGKKYRDAQAAAPPPARQHGVVCGPLLESAAALTRELCDTATGACDRLGVDIRYTMPIFADEILRRKT